MAHAPTIPHSDGSLFTTCCYSIPDRRSTNGTPCSTTMIGLKSIDISSSTMLTVTVGTGQGT